ncbi:MAG: transglutaminase-like domain-containing protein [Planctomycetales bacterium]
MRNQRTLGWLLLCLEAGGLALLSQTIAFPLGIALAGLAGALFPLRLEISRRGAFRLVVLLALAFLVKATVFPHEFPPGAAFFGTPVTHAIAQFFLMWQTGWFFVARPRDRLPLVFPMLGAIGLICMANVVVDPLRRDALQGIVIGYVLSTGLFFAAGRRTVAEGRRRSAARAAAMCGIAGLVGSTSWVGGHALDHFENDIELLINRFLMSFSASNSSVGHSGTAELGSVAFHKGDGGERVALRVVADGPPGYLRGRAFDYYSRSAWRVMSPQQRLDGRPAAPPGLPAVQPGMRLFSLRPPAARELRIIEVWPDGGDKDAVFAPLGTAHVQAPTETLSVNGHEVFERAEPVRLSSYVSIGPPPREPGLASEEPSPELVMLPPRYELRPDNPVAKLAEALFVGTDDPAEKIRRVEAWFHDNYEYDLGIHPPGDRDAVDWFLLERPPAHCEYFACGAALLLRLGGVPCRYVTGFVVHERNESGGYWIARDRDAHAWVEAWVPDRGWVIVEATPGDGVPAEAAPSDRWSRFRETIEGRARIVWTRLTRGGLQAAVEQLWNSFVEMPRVLMSFAAVGVMWLAIRFRGRRKEQPRRDPRLRALQRLRLRVDARLRRAAFVRRPEETLHHFADRILAADGTDQSLRAAAEWYRRYSAVRYRGTIAPAAIAALRRALPSG